MVSYTMLQDTWLYLQVHSRVAERANRWANLVKVSPISFDVTGREAVQHAFSLPLTRVVGTGSHLEFDNEVTFCITVVLQKI